MGFVEDYVALAKEQVPEAPVMFHEAIALYILSVVTGPNVRLEMNYGEIYPNIWILLLGESNITHKSTSMKIALDILLSVCPELDLTGEFNPEGFISELAERTNENNCRGMLHRDEFGGFMASMAREYMSGIKDILMNIYDVPRIYTRRLVKNTYVIRYPYLPFLTATTPNRAQHLFKESDAEDGFLGRFIIVNADGHNPDFIPVAPISKTLVLKKEAICKTVRKIYEDFATHHVYYTIDDDAMKLYNDWLRELRNKKMPGAIASRVPTFVLKLAILYDISERPYFISEHPKIEEYEMKQAINFIERVFLPSAQTLYDTILGDPYTEKVYRIIRSAGEGGITRTNLLRLSHLTSARLNECLYTLLESQRIKKRISGKKEYYVDCAYSSAENEES